MVSNERAVSLDERRMVYRYVYNTRVERYWFRRYSSKKVRSTSLTITCRRVVN